MRLVFDIEADGLLDTITVVHMLITHDLDTGDRKKFCEALGLPSVNEGLEYMTQADEIIGHHIIGYDLPALEKIKKWKPNPKTVIKDTLLMSQTLDYKRFANGKHNLDTWGEFLGIAKPVHEDWSKATPEMLHRCNEDVSINVEVFNILAKEFKSVYAKKPAIAMSLRNEHKVQKFVTVAEHRGWLFDKEAAEGVLADIQEEMNVIETLLVPMLKMVIKPKDTGPKEPKWIKNGNYAVATAKWFDIPVEMGREELPPIMGPYSRIEFIKPDLGSIDSVKGLLDSLGWIPDDWNWERIGNAFVKKSPKLTTSSLEPLGEIGMMVDKYYTLRSRYSIVEGWVKSVDKGNRVHGTCFTIATPTGRARHNGIVNVPGAEALFGKRIRSLFIATPGHKIIGADSSGNQMRAFCHYLGNESYTHEVINGDVHTKNQMILQEVVPTTTRKLAKPFLYAFLFGGGSEKLGLILTGKRDSKIGKKCKDIFIEKVEGLKALTDKINRVYNRTLEREGAAWIPALDGRKIYVDSPHKSLNYLLQSFEAITCKAAVAMSMDMLDAEGIPWYPLIWYHDEHEIEVPEEYEERAKEILKYAYKEAPKLLGAMIMDGEAKSGNSWYDVH